MAKRDKLGIAPQYDAKNEPTIFTLKFIHGGKMVEGHKRKYLGGVVDYFDFVDGDKFGLIELYDFVNQLGYDEQKVKFWHQFGLVELNDVAVCGLVNYINKGREVVICIQHLESVDGERCDDLLDMSFLDIVPGGSNSESGDSNSNSEDDDDVLVDSEYDMEEDDRLYEKYVDHEVDFNPLPSDGDKKKNKYVSEDVYARLEGDNEEEVNSSDGFDSISTYCIKRGMNFKYTRNDKKRLQASCLKEGCGWYIWVSPMQNDMSWQVKVFNTEHTNCGWNYKNTSIKSNWVGRHFMKKLKNNPKLGTNEFRTEVCTKLKANISKQQAYRAKKKAIELIQGTLKEQFSKIRDYCEELLRSNPGSSVVLKLIESDGEGSELQFLRLYICFEACKQGFKACRQVIGVDGCFLKGHQGGQLLTAVGIDPNNNMFPIAYAIVESETRDAWEWFLTLLDHDIGFENQYAWTFMSDKQKGLIPAFESLFPDADNRFCVQHLHSNMKKDGFLGLAIKNALWAASRATRIDEFNTRMQQIKDLDEKAYDWLVKKAPSQWSRAYFSPFPKCDILTNNMCESFNSLILPARDKPIITMLETIRNILMTRLQVNRDDAEKWDSDICPRIRMILEKNKKSTAECIPMKSDAWHFQIMGPFDQHCVDISCSSCSCRRWDLTGIPCKHAISAIWCRNEEPESYVHHHYKVETYKRAYAYPILGINGSDLWPKCGLPPPLPPKYETKPGRPKKLRRRGPNEPPTADSNPKRLKRSQKSLKCRKCGVLGHNKRTCHGLTSRTAANPSEMNPEAPMEHVEHEVIPNAASQPFSVENTPFEASPPPPKKKKLPVRRSSHGSFQAHNVSGPSTNPVEGSHETTMENSVFSKQSKTYDGKVKNKGANIIVKGGVNYITMSNLHAYIGGGSSSKGTINKEKKCI